MTRSTTAFHVAARLAATACLFFALCAPGRAYVEIDPDSDLVASRASVISKTLTLTANYALKFDGSIGTNNYTFTFELRANDDTLISSVDVDKAHPGTQTGSDSAAAELDLSLVQPLSAYKAIVRVHAQFYSPGTFIGIRNKNTGLFVQDIQYDTVTNLRGSAAGVVKTFDGNFNQAGAWTFGDFGVFDSPTNSKTAGYVGLRANDNASTCGGYWLNYNSFATNTDTIYRCRFRFATAFCNDVYAVPQLRARLNSSAGSAAYVFDLQSAGYETPAAIFSPYSTPPDREFDLFFHSPFGGQYSASYDFLNFSGVDDPDAEIRLNRMEVAAVSPAAIGWERLAVYDFVASQQNWASHQALGAGAMVFARDVARTALTITGSGYGCFGFWTKDFALIDALDKQYLYKVVFKVSSSLSLNDRELCPTFRMRVSSAGSHEMVVTSNVDSGFLPYFGDQKDYALVFYSVAGLNQGVNEAINPITISFDYIGLSPEDNNSATLYLHDVEIFRSQVKIADLPTGFNYRTWASAP